MIGSFSISILLVLAMQQSRFEMEMDCQVCHHPDHWKPLSDNRSFDHTETTFPLFDKHQITDCIQCHLGKTTEEFHQFSKVESLCSSCHMDIHFEEFGQNCEKCHTSSSWDFLSWRFKHDETLFPLIGSHSVIGCNECHSDKQSLKVLNRTTECVDCHYAVYLEEVNTSGHTENENCYLCHNTWNWFPSDMSHHDVFFPIFTGNHREGVWSTCEAECHVNPNNFKDFSCGLNGVCHEHSKSKMNGEHDDESGYRYESKACYNCHPNGSEH